MAPLFRNPLVRKLIAATAVASPFLISAALSSLSDHSSLSSPLARSFSPISSGLDFRRESTRNRYSSDGRLLCYCGLPAKLRTSQTKKNPGRLFYNCSKPKGQQCGFFMWDGPLFDFSEDSKL